MAKTVAGAREAVRWMLSNSPNAWMSIRVICKSVVGTWTSWYETLSLFEPIEDVASKTGHVVDMDSFHRKPAKPPPVHTRPVLLAPRPSILGLYCR